LGDSVGARRGGDMSQVAHFFVIKSQVVPFFIVTWPPNLMSSDTFKGISGPDSDEKLAPNIIDKYNRLESEQRVDVGVYLRPYKRLEGYLADGTHR
jgi:hypothetical protein